MNLTSFNAAVNAQIKDKTEPQSISNIDVAERIKEAASFFLEHFNKAGNAFAANAIIGLTDNFALDFYTNNVRRGRIFPDGNKAWYDTIVNAGYANDFGTNTVRTGEVRLNNSVTLNPANYNAIKRYNEGVYDGVEIVSGGAAGGYSGAFRVKTVGFNGTTTPGTSLEFIGGMFRVGGIDAAQAQMKLNNVGTVQIYHTPAVGKIEEALNLMTNTDGNPVGITFMNFADQPRYGAMVLSEAHYTSGNYSAMLSFFTQDNTTSAKSGLKRAMTISPFQMVGIGLDTSIAPAVGGAGVVLPTSRLHVKHANGWQQFRLETSYTPTSTADTNGLGGNIAWDDTYLYVRTSTGWKRTAALATF